MNVGFLLAALLVATEPAPEAAQSAPDPATGAKAVRLDIVARVGEDDERVQQIIAERLMTVVAALGAERSDSAGKTLYIVVESKGPDFVVKLATSRDDEPLARATEFACEACTGGQLLERLAEESEPVLQQLLAESQKPSPPSPVIPQPAEATAVPPDDAQSPRRLTGLGWAGVGLAAGGAAMLVAGGIVWSKGVQVRSDPDPRDGAVLAARDFRPTGIALVATGGSLLATGIVMLAVDAHRQRRRHFAIAAHPCPGSYGVVASGRF